MEIEPIKEPSPLDEVLAEERFIRSLAKKLARDDELANDVFQETLLAALRRPRRPSSPLRSWLARVVHNRVVQTHRLRMRRQEHEALADDPRAELSPAERIERDGVRAHVLRAVEEMDEPYRSAIVLRFYEDLEPRDMAAKLGVPVETARTRVKRALGLLRARLDREYGDDTPRWCSALLLWNVPGRGAGAAAAGAGSSALRWTAGLVALAGGAALLWLALGRGPTPREELALAPAPAIAAPVAAEPTGARGVERAQDAGSPLAPLAVRLVRRDDGAAVAGARITFETLEGRRVERATDAQGAVSIPWPTGRGLALAIDATETTLPHEARLTALARDQLEGPWTIAVEGSTEVEGRTIDRFGEALAAARVTVLALDADDRPDDELAPLASTSADRAGRFRLDHLPRRFALLAESPERAASDVWIADLSSARRITGLELVLDDPAPVEGQVQDRDGNALAGVSLSLSRVRGDVDYRSSAHPQTWFCARDAFEATSSFDGGFELARVPPGRYQLTLRKHGFATLTRSVNAPVRDLRLELVESVPATFWVVDALDEPVGGARALVRRSSSAERGAGAQTERAVADADGLIELEGASAGTGAWLRIEAPGYASTLAGPFEITRDATPRRIVLGAGRELRGWVRDDTGVPLAGVVVLARAAPDSDELERFGLGHSHEIFDLARAKTDERGEFLLPELARAELVLEVRPGERAAPLYAERVARDATEVELLVRAASRSGVALLGSVRSRSGDVPAGAVVSAVPQDTDARASRVAAQVADGRFRLALDAAGDWIVSVHASGCAPWTRWLRGLQVGAHELDVELEPERSVMVQVVDPRGRPVSYATLALTDDRERPLTVALRSGERRSALQVGPRGEAHLAGLPAGRVRVHVTTPLLREAQTFELDLTREANAPETLVLAGHDVELARRWLALRVVAGERSEMRLGAPDEHAADWDGHLRLTVRDAAGRAQLSLAGTLEEGRLRSDPNRQVLYLIGGEGSALDNAWLQELRPNWGAPFGRDFFPAPAALDALPIPAASSVVELELETGELLTLELPAHAADGARTLALTVEVGETAR